MLKQYERADKDTSIPTQQHSKHDCYMFTGIMFKPWAHFASLDPFKRAAAQAFRTHNEILAPLAITMFLCTSFIKQLMHLQLRTESNSKTLLDSVLRMHCPDSIQEILRHTWKGLTVRLDVNKKDLWCWEFVPGMIVWFKIKTHSKNKSFFFFDLMKQKKVFELVLNGFRLLIKELRKDVGGLQFTNLHSGI